MPRINPQSDHSLADSEAALASPIRPDVIKLETLDA